jgi:F1F0 ATPase subunit 2
MINFFPLLLSLAAGLGAGVVFFEGLWRTVSRAARSTRPVPLFAISFLLRATLLLAALWVGSAGNALRLVVGLFGFFLARTAIVRIHHERMPVAN